MKRLPTLATLLLLSLSVHTAKAQGPFYTYYAAPSQWPTNCSVVPFQFNTTWTFFIDVYNSCGALAQDTTMSVTGMGYCSGLAYLCSAISGGTGAAGLGQDAPTANMFVTGGATSNGAGAWNVTATTWNVTNGAAVAVPGVINWTYGCGGFNNTSAINSYKVGGCHTGCVSPALEGIHADTTPGQCTSPIVIDVAGEGFHLTSADDGVPFRLHSSDTNETEMAWTDPKFKNAWLVRPNPDGSVTSLAANMFGNLSPQPLSNYPNGYLALAYAAQQLGCTVSERLDEQVCPALWHQLKLWTDLNHDGIAEPSELATLDAKDIHYISLHYKQTLYTDAYGNTFRYAAAISDSTNDHRCYDVFLMTKP